MVLGKRQGYLLICVSLVMATLAGFVFASIPKWGDWISSYPQSIDLTNIPAQAQTYVGGMLGVLGPVIEQSGSYMQVAGNFGTILLSLISVAIFTAGIIVVKASKKVQ